MKLDISLKTYAACVIALKVRIAECEAFGLSTSKYLAALQELEPAMFAAIAAEIADDQSTTLHH
jgi:hypothetical protein